MAEGNGLLEKQRRRFDEVIGEERRRFEQALEAERARTRAANEKGAKAAAVLNERILDQKRKMECDFGQILKLKQQLAQLEGGQQSGKQ